MDKQRLQKLAGIVVESEEQIDEAETFDLDSYANELAADFTRMWDTSDRALDKFIRKEGKALIKQVKAELRQKVKDRLRHYEMDDGSESGKQRDFADQDRDANFY